MKIYLFLLLAAMSAHAQFFGGNAAKLRGKNIVSPLTCSDGEGIVWVDANNRFECGTVSGGGGGAPTAPTRNTFSAAATSVVVTHSYGFRATGKCAIGTTTSYVPLVFNSATTTTSATTFNFDAASGDGFCEVEANGAMLFPGAGWPVSTGSAWDTSITPGTGIATWIATPSSANLRSALTDESGTGAALFAGGNIGAATGTSLALSGALTAASVSAGSSPPAVTAGTGGVEAMGEGTAPSAGCPAVGVGCFYADSTAHRILLSNNNGTASPIQLYSDVKQGFGASFDGGGSAIATNATAYLVQPRACTIVASNILVDTGTLTYKLWKVATGTAIPTVANVINTSGIAISTGTALRTTTTSDYTTTAVAANDIIAVTLTAISGATKANIFVECNPQ
jgi:hypothetical protein